MRLCLHVPSSLPYLPSPQLSPGVSPRSAPSLVITLSGLRRLQPIADAPPPPARYDDYAMKHKHATAFDLVLWATMVGAFDLAEVLLKHKSCESPLRAALIGQARHRTVTARSHPLPVAPSPLHHHVHRSASPIPTLTLPRRCAARSG